MSMFTSEILVSDQPVEVDGTVAVSAVSGTVTVDGSGVTQPVSGTVAVSAVSGTVTVDGSGVTQPVSGTVAVSAVSGTVTVDGSGVTQPVSGTVAVSAVSGTVTVDGSGVTQPVSGTVSITPATSNSASVTPVVLTANTNATLLVANASRLGAILYTVEQPVYVKFGATASATSFTYKITAKNSTIEFPTAWVGRIDILSQNAQTVYVTEF